MRWPWNPSPRDRDVTPLPHPWWRRNWPVLAVVLAVILGLGVWKWSPWSKCGPGLTFDGRVCAGLDVGGSGFGGNDQLRSLEKMISKNNEAITGSNYVTIVYLDDMVPDPNNDIVTNTLDMHRLMGVITAQHAVNNTAIAGPTAKKVRLLLANYGSRADDESQAVAAIQANRASQHIVAVTGVGESLDNTRKAIAGLTAAGIYTISPVASGDKMNKPLPGKATPDFFRTGPTNEDTANAAVSYIGQSYKKIMLVQDQNQEDDYAYDLGSDFGNALNNKYPHLGGKMSKVTYQSHGTLIQETRPDDVQNQFANKYQQICHDEPDLIYFAGRGADLVPFLNALKQGYCNLGNVTVLSGDDLSIEQKVRLPQVQGSTITVLYTAHATGGASPEGMWHDSNDATDTADYKTFTQNFNTQFMPVNPGDLEDGEVIMVYDALLTAVKAVREDPEVTKNPWTLGTFFTDFDCQNTNGLPPGASGRIAFDKNGNPMNGLGNPIDKAVPIMKFNSDGSVAQQTLEWSDNGTSFDTECGS